MSDTSVTVPTSISITDTASSTDCINGNAPRSRIAVFADGADLADIARAYRSGAVQGFTTNPTLMRKSGVTDYRAFAEAAVKEVGSLPISLEVFADDFAEMERQARILAALGPNVFVKIPITNTRGESSAPLVRRLSADGVQLNVTAITTLEQVSVICDALNAKTEAVISVFAGRIADTGRDPVPIMTEAVRLASRLPKASVLWASPREVLNVYQAESCGCHIITITPALLEKLALRGKDLGQLSLETVKMFYDDARRSAYTL